MRRARGLDNVLVATLLAGCGPSSITLPEIPAELQAVAAEYENPTGTVPARAQQQIEDLQQKLDVISSSRVVDVMSDALAGVRRRLADAGLSTNPDTTPNDDFPRFDAYVNMNRTCRGWDASKTAPDAADGTIELNIEARRSQLQRILWGTAAGCRSRVDAGSAAVVHAFLDGALGLYLYGPLPRTVSEARFLMGFRGTLGTDTTQRSLTFDFRVLYPQVEVRIPVEDGDIIGSVGTNEISLRGRNGTFGCSLETRQCGTIEMVRL